MKKLLLFPTLILTSIGVFAQLSVRPVPSGPDSFIYVQGEILYVKDAITLTPNNTLNQEASIYLREGGQLIQGGKSTNEISNNAGLGFLSVQRKIYGGNAFAYYDLASPVGNPASEVEITVGNNKNFGINSVYEPMPVGDELGIKARMSVPTPVYEGSLNPLTISTRWLYTLEEPRTEAEADYQRFNANNLVPAGFGYTMKGVGPLNTTVNYEFRGRPNSGDFAIPVGEFLTGETGKMTLSGNPYPSALDLNQVYFDPQNAALGTIWYYDEDRSIPTHMYRDKPFGYGTWVPNGEDPGTGPNGYDNDNFPGIYTAATFFIWNNAGEQTGTNPGTGTGTSVNGKRYAPIGQGFRLVGASSVTTNTDIFIKNKHRIFKKEGPGSVFQRPENGNDSYSTSNTDMDRAASISSIPVQIDNRPPHLRLYVVFDDAYTRDMVLSFSPQATDGYDRGFDGQSPGGMKSDAYFPIEIDGQREAFVINGTNYNLEKRVPISFKLHKPSRIKILVADEVRKPYSKVYLYDSKESIYMELRGDNREGVNFSLPTGVYDGRYFIVFQRDDLETLPWPKEDLDQFLAHVGLFQNNPVQRLEVLNPEGYNIKSLNVYDMSGKLVISEKNLGDNTSYGFYTGHLSDGVYLVKLVSADDMPLDYKAIIMNK